PGSSPNLPQSVLTLSTISQKKKEPKKKITTTITVSSINSDSNLKAARSSQLTAASKTNKLSQNNLKPAA
ncbi:MAG TPA: hypothetical protein VD884_18260, partial [Ohtaekwangia sp.]|nr:hypothetical protein [Ohtaekwangia sp.]